MPKMAWNFSPNDPPMFAIARKNKPIQIWGCQADQSKMEGSHDLTSLRRSASRAEDDRAIPFRSDRQVSISFPSPTAT